MVLSKDGCIWHQMIFRSCVWDHQEITARGLRIMGISGDDDQESSILIKKRLQRIVMNNGLGLGGCVNECARRMRLGGLR